jgi:hypothetical protein
MTRMGQMIERLPPRLADGLLALAVLGAASPWLGRWLPMADLLAQFLLQITVATFGLAVLMLVARRWRRAGLAMACLVVQLATLNPDLSSAAVADDSGVRVVALNLWIDNPRPRTTLAYLRRGCRREPAPTGPRHWRTRRQLPQKPKPAHRCRRRERPASLPRR